ncbi:hypothetical protein SynMEDNS5_01779 [Synechococcus sp. MEDNS5]|nr:hypothetical protein SynMEDNS5_01779 [Synechococcus sp. MEDNS5]
MTAHAGLMREASHSETMSNRLNQQVPQMRENIPRNQAKKSLRWVMEKHGLKTMLNT